MGVSAEAPFESDFLLRRTKQRLSGYLQMLKDHYKLQRHLRSLVRNAREKGICMELQE